MRFGKVLRSIALVVLLAGASATILPSLLWGDHTDYSRVVSIKNTSEYQDPELLERAWNLPVATLYRSNVMYQRNASFCGPASIVNVLHSRNKLGNQDTILEGTGTLTIAGYLPGGLTLDEMASIARRSMDSNVTVLRDMGLAEFREHLRLSNDASRRYIVNFARGPLFGEGGGHHSPIAGYLTEKDLVLVIDVNERYRPWLVTSQRLYDAMNTFDVSAAKKRGLILIQ